MNQKNIILIVSIFVFIVAGMFTFAWLKKQELAKSTDQPNDSLTPVDAIEGPYSNIDRIDAKVFYTDGVYTLVGEILLPTPCDLLTADAIVMESYPEIINLDFSVINNAEMCAQVVTAARFMVSASASPEAQFHAHFMGRDVILNLLEPDPGETPDDFEMFVKG